MPGKAYKPNKSKAQERLMFVLEKEGKLAPGEAAGKAKATARRAGGFKALPEHVHKTAPADKPKTAPASCGAKRKKGKT